MTKVIPLLIFCFFAQAIRSQVARVSLSVDGEIGLELEPSFIKNKKIAKVIFEFSTKKPNQLIKPLSAEKHIRYNLSGCVLEEYEKKHISTISIETHILNTYDNKKLTQRIEKDGTGYFSTYYRYAQDTLITSTYRGAHYTPLTSSQNPDSTLINSTYIISNNDQEKTYNKNKVHIKTLETIKDSINLISNKKLTYQLSTTSISEDYSYNDQGLVSEIEYTSSHQSKVIKFFYDRNDVLERIESWKENQKTQVFELIYNRDGWLDAMIEQDPKTNHIKITKLHYNLYP